MLVSLDMLLTGRLKVLIKQHLIDRYLQQTVYIHSICRLPAREPHSNRERQRENEKKRARSVFLAQKFSRRRRQKFPEDSSSTLVPKLRKNELCFEKEEKDRKQGVYTPQEHYGKNKKMLLLSSFPSLRGD